MRTTALSRQALLPVEPTRVLALALIGAAVLLGHAIGSSSSIEPLVVFAAAAPLGFVALLRDVRTLSRTQGPALLPWVVVLLLPVFRLQVESTIEILGLQVLIVGLCALLVAAMSWERLRAEFAALRPLLIPALIVAAWMSIAYASAGFRTTHIFGETAALVLAPVFFIVPALVVDSEDRLERVIAILVAVGILQLVVTVLQAQGLAGSVPSVFGDLTYESWRDVNAIEGYGRYTGTLGDFELLAEYVTLLTIMGVGLMVVARRRLHRVIGLVGAVSALVTGWMTGTRGYVFALAIGLIVLVVAFVLMRAPGSRRILGRLALGLAALAIAALLAVPEDARVQMLTRLADVSLTGGSALNRGTMFERWFELAARRPVMGYGGDMLTVVRNSWGAWEMMSPHSLYFWMLLTGGVPGLVACLIWVFAVLARLVRAVIKGLGQPRLWAGVLLAAVVAWLANEVKIDAARQVFHLDWVFFVLGLAYRAAWMSLRGDESSPPPSPLDRGPT